MDVLPTSLVLLSALLHAGWNLIARQQRAAEIFLRIPLIIGALGLGPALALELTPARFPTAVWSYVLAASAFQGLYYLGLTRGYRSGDFTVVYPVARALPVLLVALADVTFGNSPTPLGWLGLLLVSVGCVAAPLESLRGISLERYWNRTILWTLVTAASTIGYTVVDHAAAARLTPGPGSAIRYHVFETSLSLAWYWTILKLLRQPTRQASGWNNWKWPLLIAALLFSSYSLILWAYQLSAQASYVVATRQFSIVLGVVAAAALFKEPAAALRIGAALTIVSGIVLIALAG